MSFIGDMLGAGKGSGFQASGTGSTDDKTINPVTMDQVRESHVQAQQGLESQRALLQALQNNQAQGILNQGTLGQQLLNQSEGRGPSPAQAQLAQNTQQNVADQAALMAGQRGAGANAGMIARQAGRQGANIQQNAVGQAATLGAQQQLSAQQQLASLSGNQIGQAANAATGYSQAAQGEQSNLFGAINGYNQAEGSILGGQNAANSATQIQNSKAQQGIFGGLLGGAGGILSDENLKTDVKPADGKIQDFLDNMGAHEYSYKQEVQGHPGAAPGRHTGPMAQELEKSELGKQMVVQTPDGKGVDFNRGLATILAAQAHLNKRLEELEGGGRKKMAEGGQVQPQRYAEGAMVEPMQPMAAPQPTPQGPQSTFGKFLKGFGTGMNGEQGQISPDNGFANSFNKSQNADNPIQSGMSSLTNKVLNNYVKPALQDWWNNMGAHPGAPASVDPNSPMPMKPGAPDARVAMGEPVPGVEAADAAETAALDGSTAAGATEGGTEVASALGSAEGAAGALEGAGAAEGAMSGGEALLALAAKGGQAKKKVPAMVSPGERYLPPSEVKAVAAGKKAPIKAGEKIPGKAKVSGAKNDYANDTVAKTLEAGGIVLPRSVTQAKDPAKKAQEFVAAILRKDSLKKGRK